MFPDLLQSDTLALDLGLAPSTADQALKVVLRKATTDADKKLWELLPVLYHQWQSLWFRVLCGCGWVFVRVLVRVLVLVLVLVCVLVLVLVLVLMLVLVLGAGAGASADARARVRVHEW